MNRGRVVSVAVLVFSLLLSGTAMAADRPDRPVRVRRGAEVPKFHVVASFLSGAFYCYSRGGDLYRDYVKDLGLEAGGDSERALVRAALSAELADKTTNTELAPYENDPEGFTRAQYEGITRKVKQIRRIWRDLLAELGDDAPKIEAYIDRMVRPGVTIADIGGPDPRLEAILDSFNAPDEPHGGNN
jgi:hypothetical protein